MKLDGTQVKLSDADTEQESRQARKKDRKSINMGKEYRIDFTCNTRKNILPQILMRV